MLVTHDPLRTRGSIRLGARERYHLAPLLGLVGDKLAEVGGRQRQHRGAEVGEARFILGAAVVNSSGGVEIAHLF
jgi:hypothetical protein